MRDKIALRMHPRRPDWLQPVTGRTCGDCRLCCKVLSIDEVKNEGPDHIYRPRDDGRVEFRKRPYVWCRHCTPKGKGGGCSVYAERPVSCAGFQCGWLIGIGGEDHRPDKIRCVTTFEESPRWGLIAVFYESYPGALRGSPRGVKLLRAVYELDGVDGIAIIPNAHLPRKMIHKKHGKEWAVSLTEQFGDGAELLIDADTIVAKAEEA